MENYCKLISKKNTTFYINEILIIKLKINITMLSYNFTKKITIILKSLITQNEKKYKKKKKL